MLIKDGKFCDENVLSRYGVLAVDIFVDISNHGVDDPIYVAAVVAFHPPVVS